MYRLHNIIQTHFVLILTSRRSAPRSREIMSQISNMFIIVGTYITTWAIMSIAIEIY